MLTLWDCCYLIIKDIPNFLISIIIIIYVVLCTSYTHILIYDKIHYKNFKLLYTASFNKVIGYIILLTLLNLTHVVIGNYEYNGLNLFFITIPANHGFYNIYITTFTVLFFREVLLTLKNINKLGINLNSVINFAEKLDKKFDKSLEEQIK